MKKILILFIFTALFFHAKAQAPLGFNYQGIARQADGTPISGQTIGVRISIIDGPQGSNQFIEEHLLQTNEFGLFIAVVGQGNGNSTLNSVDWALGNLWLQIELDPDNSGSYILMGSQQLMSVPYALFAQQSGAGLSPGYGVDINNGTISNVLPDRPVTITGAGNVQVTGAYPNFLIESNDSADADANPTNELQTIAKSGNEVTLSNGGGSFTDSVDDADADATNEIQDLQLTGNNLTITNNGTATTIDLSPYLDNTDTQLTEAEVDGFVSNNGYLTAEVDGSVTNEIQTISKTGVIVSLSNGGGSVSVADSDDDTANEIQTLSLNTNSLDLTSGGSVDLSGYLDNTDSQNLSNVLGVNNSAGNTKIIDLANPTFPQDATTKNYVDTQDTGLQTAINSEVTNRTNADTGIQTELNATQTGAGLAADGSYIADASTNYLTGVTNLKDADNLLDVEISNNASDIGILITAVGTTYAFKVPISVTTSTDLIFDLSGFTFAENNIIPTTKVEISEAGVYKFKIKGTSSLAAPSDMFISINSSDTQVNRDNFSYYNDEFLFKLGVGDVVELKIISGGSSEIFTLEFFGYKI